MSLGKRLKILRTKKELSLDDLAKKLNTTIREDEILEFIKNMRDNMNESGFKIITNRLIKRINLQKDGSLNIVLLNVCSHSSAMVVHYTPHLNIIAKEDYINVLAA